LGEASVEEESEELGVPAERMEKRPCLVLPGAALKTLFLLSREDPDDDPSPDAVDDISLLCTRLEEKK
jgi:hypothetical protein